MWATIGRFIIDYVIVKLAGVVKNFIDRFRREEEEKEKQKQTVADLMKAKNERESNEAIDRSLDKF